MKPIGLNIYVKAINLLDFYCCYGFFSGITHLHMFNKMTTVIFIEQFLYLWGSRAVQIWKTDCDQTVACILNDTQMRFSNSIDTEFKIKNSPDMKPYCATLIKTARTVIPLHGVK